MGSYPVPRQAAELSTDRHDPRDDWPKEARALADHLAGIYGDHYSIPITAGGSSPPSTMFWSAPAAIRTACWLVPASSAA